MRDTVIQKGRLSAAGTLRSGAAAGESPERVRQSVAFKGTLATDPTSAPQFDGVEKRALGGLCRHVDLAIAAFSLIALFLVFNLNETRDLAFFEVRFTLRNFLLLATFLVLWSAIFAAFGLYEFADKRWALRSGRIVFACGLGSAFVTVFPALSESGAFSYGMVPSFFIVATTLTLGSRRIIAAVGRASQRRLEHAPRQVLIVGAGPRGERAFHTMSGGAFEEVHVVGFIDPDRESLKEEMRKRTVGGVRDLESILMSHAIDDVVVALPVKTFYEEIRDVVGICEAMGVEVAFLADLFSQSVAKLSMEYRSGIPMVTYTPVCAGLLGAGKRAVDVFGSIVGLLVALPLFVVIAGTMKVASPGPVLFVQKRYGQNRRVFRMYKLRTMVPDAESLLPELEQLNEAEGPLFKIRDDPRLTGIGRFLRRSSLDEVPQLVNVLRGEMSLVGPRPMSLRDVGLFDESWLMRRFSVKPGITGLWQVRGRSDVPFSAMILHDLDYIDNWSLSRDLRIIARTIPAVLRGSGAA